MGELQWLAALLFRAYNWPFALLLAQQCLRAPPRRVRSQLVALLWEAVANLGRHPRPTLCGQLSAAITPRERRTSSCAPAAPVTVSAALLAACPARKCSPASARRRSILHARLLTPKSAPPPPSPPPDAPSSSVLLRRLRLLPVLLLSHELGPFLTPARLLAFQRPTERQLLFPTPSPSLSLSAQSNPIQLNPNRSNSIRSTTLPSSSVAERWTLNAGR